MRAKWSSSKEKSMYLGQRPRKSTGTFGKEILEIFLIKARLFPILVSDVEMCVELLKFKGVDAFKGVSQMSLVEPPVGSRYQYPKETFKYIENVVSINLIFIP